MTLRRLAKTLSLGFSPARAAQPNDYGQDPQETAPADHEQPDGTSWWGAVSASTADAAAAAASVEVAGLETPAAGLPVSAAGRGGGVRGAPKVGGSSSRFRTFTVVCASTAVTEKGARVAEAASPGLLVLFENQPAACWT